MLISLIINKYKSPIDAWKHNGKRSRSTFILINFCSTRLSINDRLHSLPPKPNGNRDESDRNRNYCFEFDNFFFFFRFGWIVFNSIGSCSFGTFFCVIACDGQRFSFVFRQPYNQWGKRSRNRTTNEWIAKMLLKNEIVMCFRLRMLCRVYFWNSSRQVLLRRCECGSLLQLPFHLSGPCNLFAFCTKCIVSVCVLCFFFSFLWPMGDALLANLCNLYRKRRSIAILFSLDI